MSVYLQDLDVTIHQGDTLDVLRSLPDEAVDCVITSPPYWGLRSYLHEGHEDKPLELGLEATPDLYVARMVEVFREVRRVLRPAGTVWLNLGDSYNNRTVRRRSSHQSGLGFESDDLSKSWAQLTTEGRTRLSIENGDMKEKDLVGVPWMVAFALRADGWWLRSEIIWAKPNPMPESVTDRPTKAHEQVFLLTKAARYWYDADAVREPAGDYIGHSWEQRKELGEGPRRGFAQNGISGLSPHPAGRNLRSVWEIATQPYPEAHFATYPEELVRRCLLAGCPAEVCGTCGKARERIVERISAGRSYAVGKSDEKRGANLRTAFSGYDDGSSAPAFKTVGWSDCGHQDYRPGVVLDPFLGSGTTAHVARKHGRRSIGIELNETYCQLAAKRLQQQSLFALDLEPRPESLLDDGSLDHFMRETSRHGGQAR